MTASGPTADPDGAVINFYSMVFWIAIKFIMCMFSFAANYAEEKTGQYIQLMGKWTK